MIIRSDIENAAAKQLGIDLNCEAQDFFRLANRVTLPSDNEGRRNFSDKPHFFRAATMGMGTVICAAEAITPYAELLAEQRSGAEIFSAECIAGLNRQLFSHGCCIGVMNEYFLPKMPMRPPAKRSGFEIKVFEGSEIEGLYELEGFENALLHRTEGSRRDIIAVCAISGRTVTGIAGASLDSSTMAQIGIDVLPQYRSMGIGSYLAAQCAAEVFAGGLIPYYGTWSGNVISRRLAQHCGFYPAWCEMFSCSINS